MFFKSPKFKNNSWGISLDIQQNIWNPMCPNSSYNLVYVYVYVPNNIYSNKEREKQSMDK